MSWWRGSHQIRERGSLKLLLLALVYLALGIQRKEKKNETGIPLRILYPQTNLDFWSKHPNLLFFQVDHFCSSIKIQNDFRTYFRTGHFWNFETFIIKLSILREIAKMITRVDSRIFTNSPFIWFLRLSWKWPFR